MSESEREKEREEEDRGGDSEEETGGRTRGVNKKYVSWTGEPNYPGMQ